MRPDEVTSKEFVVGVRGYVREEVRAFLRSVAEDVAKRDARISALEHQLAALKGRDQSSLHALVGDEIRQILDAAHSAAEQLAAWDGRERRKPRLAAVKDSRSSKPVKGTTQTKRAARAAPADAPAGKRKLVVAEPPAGDDSSGSAKPRRKR